MQIRGEPPVAGRPPADLPRHLLNASLALAAVVVATLVGISVAVSSVERPLPGTAVATSDGMTAVAPGGVLDPTRVPAGLEAHYQAAEAHYEIFTGVPCFCGCEAALGHRHLGDCFLRPDGRGWEAHAVGCGVCLGEAAQVSELIEAGTVDPVEIRRAVVAQWGDPYSPDT